ncbi:hypothetical protein PMIN03_004847 [Paraphaeosphaeria minitans]
MRPTGRHVAYRKSEPTQGKSVTALIANKKFNEFKDVNSIRWESFGNDDSGEKLVQRPMVGA